MKYRSRNRSRKNRSKRRSKRTSKRRSKRVSRKRTSRRRISRKRRFNILDEPRVEPPPPLVNMEELWDLYPEDENDDATRIRLARLGAQAQEERFIEIMRLLPLVEAADANEEDDIVRTVNAELIIRMATEARTLAQLLERPDFLAQINNRRII